MQSILIKEFPEITIKIELVLLSTLRKMVFARISSLFMMAMEEVIVVIF